MNIRVDDLSGPEIAAFLEEHLNDMHTESPPGSRHALNLDSLRKPNITFWTVWEDENLVGCGAMKELDNKHGEVKSMRVASHLRGKGIASRLLEHIIFTARDRGYHKLSLETGAMDFFKPAHNLYRKNGFVETGPFADYSEDSNSKFMELVLR